MKRFILITTTVFLSTLFACKKERNETVTVIRDCTGTYLRFEGKDYQVSNPDKVAEFVDGSTVTATFRKANNCATYFCMMVHPYEVGGCIKVTKIK